MGRVGKCGGRGGAAGAGACGSKVEGWFWDWVLTLWSHGVNVESGL